MSRLFLLAIVFLSINLPFSQAAVQRGRDPTLGSAFIAADGMNLAIDEETGLEWLDLTLTRGMRFSTVQSLLGSKGALEGFSYANAIQVAELFRHLGLRNTYPTATVYRTSDPNREIYDAAVALIGETDPEVTGFFDHTQGWHSVTVLDHENVVASAASLQEANHFLPPVSQTFVETPELVPRILPLSHSLLIGHYLVRSSIPEPTSLNLVVWGLLGIICLKRRQREWALVALSPTQNRRNRVRAVITDRPPHTT